MVNATSSISSCLGPRCAYTAAATIHASWDRKHHGDFMKIFMYVVSGSEMRLYGFLVTLVTTYYV